MPDKNFLENYPLYRKFDLDSSFRFTTRLPSPAIHMYCDECKSEQTFKMINDYSENMENTTSVDGEVLRAVYLCSGCDRFRRYFYLSFVLVSNKDFSQSKLEVRKVGQYPAWEISPDKEFSKFLGDYLSLYKKGLTCESQSYGIAAFAYYRRITEEIIGQILTAITELLNKNEQKEYLDAIKKAEKTTVTEDKIDIVKNFLPDALKIDGVNPLSVLHKALSAGLHAKSDEECMSQAAILRTTLVYLVQQIIRQGLDKKNFSESLKKINN